MRMLPSAGSSASLTVGIVLLAMIALLVAGSPWLASHDPLEQQAAERLQSPDLEHPLGTDRFGRDVWARTLHGGKTTLLSSLAALGAAMCIGLTAGLVAGMFRGTLADIVLMRIVDVLLAFPFMVLAIVIAALFGTSFVHLLMAVVSVWWVSFARLARSAAIQAANETSYAAAIVLSAPKRVLLLRELFPKALSSVLALAPFELGSLILSISALSFLGLGAQPPTPEWGSMLADGRDHLMTAPHVLIGPACFMMLTVLAFNLIGEGLRDRLDPYEIPSL